MINGKGTLRFILPWIINWYYKIKYPNSYDDLLLNNLIYLNRLASLVLYPHLSWSTYSINSKQNNRKCEIGSAKITINVTQLIEFDENPTVFRKLIETKHTILVEKILVPNLTEKKAFVEEYELDKAEIFEDQNLIISFDETRR